VSFPSSNLDQIKSNLDIVQVIGEFVPLQRKGNSYFGLCPFHQEKSPSFSVSSERQLFHCFGCKAGGDIFKFYQLYHRSEFPQAVEELAKKAGIVLEQSERSGDWDESLKILESVAVFFEKSLWAEEGIRFREYLNSREISEESARTFRLGAHLGGSREIADWIHSQSLSRDLAVRLGILGRSAGGEFVDRWRGRLIFPIADDQGKIRGFGARSLGDEQPKYINSPASPVFDKKRLLYGMNLASEALRRKDFVILVEGYMDVIALHRQGIKNVVGTMGTALSVDQVRKLKRWTHRFLSLFDGDAAGLQASERNLELFIREAIFAKVLVLPGAKDPDAFFRDFKEDFGAARKAWKLAAQSARPAIDFLIEARVLSEKDSVRRAMKLRELVDLLDRSPDPLQRIALKKEISKRFDIPWEMLESRGEGSDGQKEEQAPPRAPYMASQADSKPSAGESVVYREMLKLLVLWGKDREFLPMEILPYMRAEGLRSATLIDLIREGQDFSTKDWWEILPEELKIEAREWLMEKALGTEEESLDLAWTQIGKRLKSDFFKKESTRLQQELKRAESQNDLGTMKEILQEKQDLIRMLGENTSQN
jgi:DNA primase